MALDDNAKKMEIRLARLMDEIEKLKKLQKSLDELKKVKTDVDDLKKRKESDKFIKKKTDELKRLDRLEQTLQTISQSKLKTDLTQNSENDKKLSKKPLLVNLLNVFKKSQSTEKFTKDVDTNGQLNEKIIEAVENIGKEKGTNKGNNVEGGVLSSLKGLIPSADTLIAIGTSLASFAGTVGLMDYAFKDNVESAATGVSVTSEVPIISTVTPEIKETIAVDASTTPIISSKDVKDQIQSAYKPPDVRPITNSVTNLRNRTIREAKRTTTQNQGLLTRTKTLSTQTSADLKTIRNDNDEFRKVETTESNNLLKEKSKFITNSANLQNNIVTNSAKVLKTQTSFFDTSTKKHEDLISSTNDRLTELENMGSDKKDQIPDVKPPSDSSRKQPTTPISRPPQAPQKPQQPATGSTITQTPKPLATISGSAAPQVSKIPTSAPTSQTPDVQSSTPQSIPLTPSTPSVSVSNQSSQQVAEPISTTEIAPLNTNEVKRLNPNGNDMDNFMKGFNEHFIPNLTTIINDHIDRRMGNK